MDNNLSEKIKYLRSFRVKKIALFDLISSFIMMAILALILQRTVLTEYKKSTVVIVFLALTIPVGIIFHYMFGIKTTINTYIGL